MMTTQSVILNPFQPQTEHGERLIRRALELVEEDHSCGSNIPILTHFVAAGRLANFSSFFFRGSQGMWYRWQKSY